MSLSGMTITLFLLIGVMSVAFAKPNPVAFESPDYLAELEESNAKEDVQNIQDNNCNLVYSKCRTAGKSVSKCVAEFQSCLNDSFFIW